MHQPGGYCMLGGECTTLKCTPPSSRRRQPSGAWGTDGWKPTTAEAADTFTARYTGRTGQEHKRASDREQTRTTTTSNNGPPKGACTPAGRPRWGFHPCNHTANTTQVNQGGGPAATVQDGPGPQACLEESGLTRRGMKASQTVTRFRNPTSYQVMVYL